MKKRILSFAVMLTVLSKLFVLIAGADNGINILLNGKRVVFNDNTGYPYVDENNRTMVPLRVTMESAGFVVGYDQNAKTAIVITEHSRIEVPIGTNKIYVNNTLKENDTIAVIKDDRTYLPIRMVLEAAHYTVEWDDITKTVNAYTYQYDSNAFVPYSTSSLSSLIENLLNGNVVYLNGQYYATPEYIKMLNTVQVHYSGDDLNSAIYPQSSRYDMADYDISSLTEEQPNATEWISEYKLAHYDPTLNFSSCSDSTGNLVPALVKSTALTGIVTDRYVLSEMPLDFAERKEGSGTFNGINVKVVDGELFFLYADLIKVGVLE